MDALTHKRRSRKTRPKAAVAIDTPRPDGGPMLAPEALKEAPLVALAAVSALKEPAAIEPAKAAKPIGRVWSPFQTAIFDDTAIGTGHSVIKARAGTGKTTVICEALKHVPSGLSTLTVAFNNKIKDELLYRQAHGKCVNCNTTEPIGKCRKCGAIIEGDLPSHVDIKTCHGYGFAACMAAYRSKLDNHRTLDIIDGLHGTSFEKRNYKTALAKAVSFAKGCLCIEPREIASMLNAMLAAGQIEESWDNDDSFVKDIIEILDVCRKQTSVIDFDDMPWLPVVNGLSIKQYDS